MPLDRCGYAHNVEGVTDLGPTCCWRPVRESDDRCVWHSDGQVARDEYERHGPAAGRRLDGARLNQAPLSEIDWLAGRVFVGADFTEATLDGTDLSGADLREATFRNVSAEEASFDGANLRDASFAYADLRGASLESAELYRANLADARIDQETLFDETVVSEREALEQETGSGVSAGFTAATWVYRGLQRLFEENAMPERVRDYYRQEMELRRRVAWRQGEHFRALYLETSRWVMRYGTSPWRVLGTSFLLIVLCALVYPTTGGIREVAGDTTITYRIADLGSTPSGHQLQVFFKSLYFSVVTFSSLGYGDIQPVGPGARAVASIETLLGTLLMALLIFVLTRRFY